MARQPEVPNLIPLPIDLFSPKPFLLATSPYCLTQA
jgi:hypothetical protein